MQRAALVRGTRVTAQTVLEFLAAGITSSPPPRAVHLRFGNLRGNEYHALLARRWSQIELLLKIKKLANVYIDRLEGMG